MNGRPRWPCFSVLFCLQKDDFISYLFWHLLSRVIIFSLNTSTSHLLCGQDIQFKWDGVLSIHFADSSKFLGFLDPRGLRQDTAWVYSRGATPCRVSLQESVAVSSYISDTEQAGTKTFDELQHVAVLSEKAAMLENCIQFKNYEKRNKVIEFVSRGRRKSKSPLKQCEND